MQCFLQDRAILHKAGLDLADIRPVMDLISKCGTEEILKTAKEMSVEVSKTGFDPKSLVTEYKLIAELRDKAIGDLKQARAGTAKSQDEMQQLRQARTDQLARNHLTDTQLENFLVTKRQLASWGIDIGMIEPLKKILSEIERHGFQTNDIVAYLKAIVSLQEQKRQLESQATDTKTELSSGRKTLRVTNEEISARGAELAKLKASENQTVSTLSHLQLQIIQSRDRVELVDAFVQLLHDPATITDEHIGTVIGSLQQILNARATVKRFPIDYGPLRSQFRRLVQEALGDKLIARETLDTETRKLNAQRAIYVSKEKDLDLERSRLSHMSQAKLLKAAAGQNREGVVFVGICEICKAMAAIRRGSTSSYLNSYHCPCCWGTLDPRPLSKPK